MMGHGQWSMGVWPRLIALTDDRVIAGGRVVERAAAMAGAAGSALCVGLRSRALGDGDLHALAVRLAGVLAPHGSLLAVSGRADIARSVGAAIVLAGRGAMATADLKRVSPQAAVIRSVHDRAEIEAARADGADAVMAGPVFETASHPGAPAAGVSLVTAALAAAPKAFAVGGITSERVAEVLAAGAWGVAAIRALWDSDDPAAAAGAFLEALRRGAAGAIPRPPLPGSTSP